MIEYKFSKCMEKAEVAVQEIIDLFNEVEEFLSQRKAKEELAKIKKSWKERMLPPASVRSKISPYVSSHLKGMIHGRIRSISEAYALQSLTGEAQRDSYVR